MYPLGVAGPLKIFEGTFKDKKAQKQNVNTTFQAQMEPNEINEVTEKLKSGLASTTKT